MEKAFIFILFFISSFFIRAEPRPLEYLGKVLRIEGKGIIKNKFGENRILKKGSDLKEHEYIFLDKKTKVKLLLENNSLLNIGENSIIGFTKKDKKVSIDFRRGSLRFLEMPLYSKKSTNELRTPLGQIDLFPPSEGIIEVFGKESQLLNIMGLKGKMSFGDQMILKGQKYHKIRSRGHSRWTLIGQESNTQNFLLSKGDAFAYEIDKERRQLRALPINISISFYEKENEELAEKIVKRKPASIDTNEIYALEEIQIDEELFDQIIQHVEREALRSSQKLTITRAIPMARKAAEKAAYKAAGFYGYQAAKKIVKSEAERAALLAINNLKEQRAYNEELLSLQYNASELALKAVKRKSQRIAEVVGRKKAFEESKKAAWNAIYTDIYEDARNRAFEMSLKKGYEVVEGVGNQKKLIKNKNVEVFVRYIATKVSENFAKQISTKIGTLIVLKESRKASEKASIKMGRIISEKLGQEAVEMAKILASKKLISKTSRRIASKNVEDSESLMLTSQKIQFSKGLERQ